MKRLLLAISAIVTLAASANAAELRIATGKEGGGYDAMARDAGQRLAQRGHTVTLTNYNGSDEISLALCNDTADIGWMQIDAMFARAKEGCVLSPVAVYGNGEYAMLMVPPKSKIDELSDLTAEHSVLVDTIGSGTDLFWHTIVGIEQGEHGNKSEWAQAKPVNDGLYQADVLHQFGDIDAAVIVGLPSSGIVKTLQSLGWELAEFWDKDINDQMFNDKPLYESSKEKVGKQKEYVYKVKSFVVSRNDPAVLAAVKGQIR